MRTHHNRSSSLDGMPLTFDALRERSVLGLVCLDKWVRFSALHMTMLKQGLHTLTPGPDSTTHTLSGSTSVNRPGSRLWKPTQVGGFHGLDRLRCNSCGEHPR